MNISFVKMNSNVLSKSEIKDIVEELLKTYVNRYLAAFIILSTIVMLLICLNICLLRRYHNKVVKLNSYDYKFERQIFQPPIRQSTTLDLNYYNDEEKNAFSSAQYEPKYTEEDEKSCKRLLNKNVNFTESPVDIKEYADTSRSYRDQNGIYRGSESEEESQPAPIYYNEQTSSDSEDTEYMYQPTRIFNNYNVNTNDRRVISPLKPLADVLKVKFGQQRPTLETCLEESTDSEMDENIKNNIQEMSSYKKCNGQVSKYEVSQRTQTRTKLKMKTSYSDHLNIGDKRVFSINHETNFKNSISKSKAMKRSQSWDPKIQSFILE